MRALRAEVFGFDHESVRQRILNREDPLLRVSKFVAGVDGVGVGEAVCNRRLRQKTILDGQRIPHAGAEGYGSRERRLRRQLANDLRIGRSTVENTVAAANGRAVLTPWPPGES